ncbi:MAG: glycosyltransferase family 4 protein [Calditrichaeota bacterium]|nr:glycosyltransferase family 4 protein [Calditrichota bacterium]
MKKVLFITYYWPPAGGPGVQRVLKFAKYLPQFGWQPIVLTVKNGEYPALDSSLETEVPEICKVVKTYSLEPAQLYKSFVGMKRNEPIPTAVITERGGNWKKRLAHWIRLNFFIPDAKITWKPLAVKTGKNIIKTEKPDLIFSSSPPPTVHLIAKNLTRWSGLKWVADFRDPWTDIYYYDAVPKNRFVKAFESNLEQAVLNKADCVVTVSKYIAEMLAEKMVQPDKLQIISNGFDEDDFKGIDREQRFKKFTIAYAGKLAVQQNTLNLWKALENLVKNHPHFAEDFQLLFMGKFSPEILKEIDLRGLKPYFLNKGYLPHKEALQNLIKSHILLLVIPATQKNKGIITGKLFDYMATHRFILNIGPVDGDAARIIDEANCGRTFDFNQDPQEEILRLYNEWKTGKKHEARLSFIEQFSRRNLAKKLTEIFEEVIAPK